jgi:PHO85 cyclin-5
MSLDIFPHNFGLLPETHPYAATLSSSASSSTSSVFSDAASQASSASSTSQHSQWESEEWSSTRPAGPTIVDPASLSVLQPITRVSTYPQYQPSACRETVQERLPSLRSEIVAPMEQRLHPRRSSTAISQRGPPQLVRQSERKVNFVDCLVDSATQMVEVIWQLSEPKSRCETPSGPRVLPLRTFIQETLKRSRTSYSTLQVALYYLILIKAHLPKHDFTMSQPEDASLRALQCGRRMFLAALILASKYLQDRNYSARAWSKISGLKVCEINTNEMAFLEAVNWKLHITDPIWEKWQEVVLRHTPTNPPSSPGAPLTNTWRDVIPTLTPELEIIEVSPKAPITPVRPALRPQLSASPLRQPSSDGYGSQESTPTPSRYQVPRFLEPKPDLLPPTPSLPRMSHLPTPSLTPQSYASNTPAAGAMAYGSRRPSMCSAMQQAQCSSLARTCVDQFNPSVRNGLEAYHFPSRRPSLAPSNSSLSSSPESMVSDNSRSSRASSISSVSSVGWAPNQSQAKLARLATCRSARLPYPALSKCKEQYEYAPSEPMSSPDLDSFHIDDIDAKTGDSPTAMATPSRKRGRSSVDLQQNVRHLLHSTRSAFNLGSHRTVLPDRSIAQSFILDSRSSCSEPKGLQSPKPIVPNCSRLPIQKDFGKKRTCCGTEAAQGFRPQGPGMWEGIL